MVDSFPENVAHAQVAMVNVSTWVSQHAHPVHHQLHAQRVGMSMGGNTAKAQSCMIHPYQNATRSITEESVPTYLEASAGSIVIQYRRPYLPDGLVTEQPKYIFVDTVKGMVPFAGQQGAEL